MNVSNIRLKGFRNFLDTSINFQKNTLVIDANDVGKTNMLYALRLLLDKSLSDADIEPSELDFHLKNDGPSEELEIMITLDDVTEDAVISSLKGCISDDHRVS